MIKRAYRAMAKTCGKALSACGRLFRLVPSRSPYGHVPPTPLRVTDAKDRPFKAPDGQDLNACEGGVAYVSRHGFLESGVTCPICSAVAARPGDWHKISYTKRGEGVNCTSCHHTLLASPDDDKDPVKPGESYDENIYHRFARPFDHGVVRQRTVTDPPGRGDRVLIEVDADGPYADAHKYDNQEANIIADEGELWRVALNGNEGIGGNADLGGTFASIPKACVFKCADMSLRLKDQVQVLKADGAVDYAGVLTAMKEGLATVAPAGSKTAPVDRIPIERIQKIIANERPLVRSAPSSSPTKG